jgi:hypothetical protein
VNESVAEKQTDQLNENDIVALTAAHLRNNGWVVHQALTVNMKGPDIIAGRGGERLYGEAKGAVGSKTGKTLDAYGASVSALMQVSAIRSRTANDRVAIIVPDLEIFRYHMTSVYPVVLLAKMEVWFVTATGSVRIMSGSEEPLPWPQPLLPKY